MWHVYLDIIDSSSCILLTFSAQDRIAKGFEGTDLEEELFNVQNENAAYKTGSKHVKMHCQEKKASSAKAKGKPKAKAKASAEN